MPKSRPTPASAPRSWLSALGAWLLAPFLSPLALRSYFYSGWAFFIPYLAFYLLYHWREWPANSFAPSAIGNGGHIPALLHVYWGIHAIHLALAAIALRSWWRGAKREALSAKCLKTRPEQAECITAPATGYRPLSTAFSSVAPWLLLTLVFAIPGVYLEWPSDPWEHLRRITEWQTHPVVGDHSAGYKSFYFFAYSLVGSLPPTGLQRMLPLYGAGMCMLLAWQYYRFAHAAGLSKRLAFAFVVVHSLTFGNSCFSFHRYYGLSTTMFAQVAAVGLTRVVLQFCVDRLRNPQPAGSEATRPKWNGWAGLLASGGMLAWLISCSHAQGLAIAGLGAGAVLLWTLTERRRRWSAYALGLLLVFNLAVWLWWPRSPQLDVTLRATGWLNDWSGFNLTNWNSPAAERALELLGLVGLVDLAAAGVLTWRRHVIGWITLLPVASLLLPLVAIPFSSFLIARGPTDIVTFHRILLAVPTGLALFALLAEMQTGAWPDSRWTRTICPLAIPASLSLLALLPAGNPAFSRLWHALYAPPVGMYEEITASASADIRANTRNYDATLVGSPAALAASSAIEPLRFPSRERQIGEPASAWLERSVALVLTAEPTSSQDHLSLLPVQPADKRAWSTIAGELAQFALVVPRANCNYALQNPPGQTSYVLSSEMIPISPDCAYVVEISARQLSSSSGSAYLAIAWYDERHGLLPSNLPAPEGADSPTGWANGTYSYFGLAGGIPTRIWSTHRQSFGHGKGAAIPRQARFLRLGGLLNYNRAPDAAIQLSNIQLWEARPGEIMADGSFPDDQTAIVVASGRQTVAPASQAALESRHWPAYQLMIDRSGAKELIAALRKRSRRARDAGSVTAQANSAH